jgi:hypothetical protein
VLVRELIKALEKYPAEAQVETVDQSTEIPRDANQVTYNAQFDTVTITSWDENDDE